MCTNLSSEPFLDYLYKVWHYCCLHYTVTCGKNSIKMHIYIPCSKVLQQNFFQCLSYLYEVVHTNFFTDFWTFTIFDGNFPKIVAPACNKNKNYLAHLKGQSLLKKTLQTASKSTINSDTKPAQSTPPRTNSVPASEWQKKTNIQTPYVHIYSRRALYDLPKTLQAIALQNAAGNYRC